MFSKYIVFVSLEDFEGDSEDGESDAERCSKLQRVDVNPRKHQKTDHHTKQNKKTGGKKQSKEWQNENKGTIKTARSKGELIVAIIFNIHEIIDK